MTRSRLGLRGIRTDRDCRNCKSRGVKCDLNRPRCLPCVQAGLTCGGYLRRVVWASNKTLTASNTLGNGVYDASPELPGPNPTETTLDHERASGEGTSLSGQPLAAPVSRATPAGCPAALIDFPSAAGDQRWFSQRLLALCTGFRLAGNAGDPEQCARAARITTDLLEQVENSSRSSTGYETGSMARSSPTSLDSLDAGILSATMNARSNPAELTFELQYIDALASLNQALRHANPVAFLGVLVLAHFEVVSASAFGEWQFHLRGARSLLDHHCQSRNDFDQLRHTVPDLRKVIAYFSWWDVAGVVIRHLNGSQADSQECLILLDWHRDLIGPEFFDTVGCPPEIFQIFVSLAKCADTSQESKQQEDALAKQSRIALAMEQLLQLGLVASDQGLCRDTWRCASVIALVTWDSPPPDTPDPVAGLRQKTLRSAVDRICSVISSIPPTSRFYAHMAKPAFLAGINATHVTQCKILRGYWRNCQTGGIPRHLAASGRCEEKWKSFEVR